MRDRACGAVIVDKQILMVRHVQDGRDFWTLPGGGIEQGETPEVAVAREIREETGLELEAKELLFDYEYSQGKTFCYLMTPPAPDHLVRLGSDPEQSHLPKGERSLQNVAWHSIRSKRSDLQVSQVIECLGIE
ncbi:MAG: NUDIX hydrolase [Gammaproteobacteria bacterium]|nr:NUDIX hydrolase [Gammaproteobacteria bacterium]